MTTPLFPIGLFGLAQVGPPSLTRRALSGGQALTGETQMVEQTGGGSWQISASGQLKDPSKIKAWLALEGQIGDGATPAVVEWPLRRFNPVGKASVRRPFQWPPVAFSGIRQASSVLRSSTALRATSLAITFNAPKPLMGGEHFTIVHATWGERAYRVIEVVDQDAGTADIKIRPPLREACTSGTVLDFDDPRCLMKVVSGAMKTDINLLQFATVQVQLVESRQPAAT